MRFFNRTSRKSGRVVLARNGLNAIATSVVLVEDKPRVTACSSHDMPEHGAQAWTALARDLGLSGKACTLLLGSGEYQLMQVESPGVPAEETRQALGWKIKDMLAFPVEQAVIEYVAIPADQNSPNRTHYLYAISSRSDLIREYMDDFDQAGAGLDVIDIPELAQRNIATLLEEEGRCLAMLSFNEQGGLLTYTSAGELYHARTLEISGKQLALTDKEALEHVYERLLLELQRSLDNFERQFSYLALNKLVLAPMQGQAALEEYLRENLYVQVQSLDLSEVMNLAAVEELENPAFQARCFLALGAALRPEAA